MNLIDWILLIGVIILLASAFYLATRRNRSCHSGCASCSSRDNCPHGLRKDAAEENMR